MGYAVLAGNGLILEMKRSLFLKGKQTSFNISSELIFKR